MTDLQLLDSHGPAATALRSTVLDRARLNLLDEAALEPRARTVRLSPTRPPASRRRFVGAGLIAASLTGAAVLLPSTLGLGSSNAVALAPMDPFTFPLTPHTLPPGLGDTVFELSSDFKAARYLGGHDDRLSVTTDVASREFWSIPDDSRPVDIAGQAGVAFDGVAFHGTPRGLPSVSVVWQDAAGVWTRVEGEGGYADPMRVESFAESLRAEPQPVELGLEVAPRDWSVIAYKDDRVVTLAPDDGPSGTDLSVLLLGDRSPDFGGDYGVDEVTTARIHGREAFVGRGPEGWIVEAETQNGRVFSVAAPESFTRAQVLEVAEGVTYTP